MFSFTECSSSVEFVLKPDNTAFERLANAISTEKKYSKYTPGLITVTFTLGCLHNHITRPDIEEITETSAAGLLHEKIIHNMERPFLQTKNSH